MAAAKRQKSVATDGVVIAALLGTLIGSIVGNILINLVNRPWLSQIMFAGGRASAAGNAKAWTGGLGQALYLTILWGENDAQRYVLYFHLLAVVGMIAAIATYVRLKRR